jgi:HupE / UreJ protein
VSELLTFVHLGFRHIVDIGAADHILFLLALAAIYQPRDWRDAMWVVTAFTVGHSITLALAVTGVLTLPTSLIEFLIPVTILITGVENIVVHDRGRALWGGRYRPIFAGVFGLVHGAGFANYLKSMFVDHVALPLFGFNVGIELGQIVVLFWAFLVLWAVDRLLARVRLPMPAPTPVRLRVIAVSALVTAVAASWAVQRSPLFTAW